MEMRQLTESDLNKYINKNERDFSGTELFDINGNPIGEYVNGKVFIAGNQIGLKSVELDKDSMDK